jgi:hypothetical protein
MANNYKNNRLLTYADMNEESNFPIFKNGLERIKYMKKAYSNMSLSKAFSIYYDIDIAPEIKTNKYINNVQDIEVGKIYSAVVKSFDKNGIEFDMPGVKDEII